MLKFTKEHEWLKLEGDVATVGSGVVIGKGAVVGPKAMVSSDVKDGEEQW